jgi:hypothetical protein
MRRCNFSYGSSATGELGRCSDVEIPELADRETFPTNQACRTNPGTSCDTWYPVETGPGVPYVVNADGSVTFTYVQVGLETLVVP